jgi:hypothetical protein
MGNGRYRVIGVARTVREEGKDAVPTAVTRDGDLPVGPRCGTTAASDDKCEKGAVSEHGLSDGSRDHFSVYVNIIVTVEPPRISNVVGVAVYS